MQKFFLYARKSTDVEDKQVLSIEAQLTELRAFAKQNNLEIIREFVEKKSAKIPGRPIFNDMLARLEKGEAEGILAWHPDRLARNSVDGGKIIYLIDCGRITALKFPQFWFEPTPQGKFMLNIAFGQSKYYVDSLSENTKRGLRQKVRRGEYPGLVPIGYLNDPRTKSIVVDKKFAPVVRQMFELYAEGNHRLDIIVDFLAQQNIFSKSGKRIHISRVTFILANPFYTGLFRYSGELYEGTHEPIIAKSLYDRVQEVLKQRGKPRKESVIDPQVFCGLLKCGTCGMMVTGEYRVKRQVSGLTHHYIYYHCTKKKKDFVCPEPYIRQEELDKQLSSLLQTAALPTDWAATLSSRLDHDKGLSAQSVAAFVQKIEIELKNINSKLQRLLDGYLEQDIDRLIYREQKNQLMLAKKSLEEQKLKFEQKQNDWIEPMQKWIKRAENMEQIARDANLFEKKVAAKEIFGSNLLLSAKQTRLAESKTLANPGENAWAALRAAREMIGQRPSNLICEPMVGIEPTTYSLPWSCSTS